MEVWSLAIPSHSGSLNIIRKYKFDKCKSFTWEEAISKKKITSSSTGEEVNILGPWQIYSSCFSTRCGADTVVETPCGTEGGVVGPGHHSLQFPHLQHSRKRTESARLPCWHLPACLQVSGCPQSGASLLAFSFMAAGLRAGWERAGANGFVPTGVRPHPSWSSPPSHSMHKWRSLRASRDLDAQTFWPFLLLASGRLSPSSAGPCCSWNWRLLFSLLAPHAQPPLLPGFNSQFPSFTFSLDSSICFSL